MSFDDDDELEPLLPHAASKAAEPSATVPKVTFFQVFM
jgi:hypothetical protein